MIEFQPIPPYSDHHVEPAVGYIPEFLSESDPRPAAQQIDSAYIAGWQPFKGFTLDRETMTLSYPGDPSFGPIAKAQLRDEQIYVYPHAWTLILSPSGDWEIARLD